MRQRWMAAIAVLSSCECQQQRGDLTPRSKAAGTGNLVDGCLRLHVFNIGFTAARLQQQPIICAYKAVGQHQPFRVPFPPDTRTRLYTAGAYFVTPAFLRRASGPRIGPADTTRKLPCMGLRRDQYATNPFIIEEPDQTKRQTLAYSSVNEHTQIVHELRRDNAPESIDRFS